MWSDLFLECGVWIALQNIFWIGVGISLQKKLECQIHWQGLGKHLVDNAPSVGILRFSKNPVDARECFFQQRAKSLNLAGA